MECGSVCSVACMECGSVCSVACMECGSVCSVRMALCESSLFPQKLHQIGLSLGQGSEIKINQPWVTEENGYTSCVTGALVDVVVTSDLSYPHLGNANTLQVHMYFV